MKDATTTSVLICESRKSDRTAKVMNAAEFTPAFQSMLDNGDIYGVYYDKAGKVVAEDIWQQIHRNILA